jgi:hypothetical protein
VPPGVVHPDVVQPGVVQLVDERAQHRTGQPGGVDLRQTATGRGDRRAAGGHDDGGSGIHRRSA